MATPVAVVPPNVAFHSNRLRIVVRDPDEYTIEELHTECFDDFHLLESSHSYIQWLFPTDESSRFNRDSAPLTPSEAVAIATNVFMSLRLVYSFAMMLRFYGFVLDPYGQAVRLGDDHVERLQVLNASVHNWLRITRMLRCLVLCGLRVYAESWLIVLRREVDDTKRLADAARSCADFWRQAVEKPSGLDWPTTNRVYHLIQVATQTPTTIGRFMATTTTRENVPVSCLYMFRRLLREQFADDVESDELDCLPWLVMGAHSHKKMFLTVPSRAVVVVVNPRTMRIRRVALARLYKARLRSGGVTVGFTWFVDSPSLATGVRIYGAIRSSCVGGGDGWLAVWFRKR